VNATDENGNLPASVKPIYWDIRFSNFCNFRCRICGPWSSSKWYHDAAELGMLSRDARLTTCANNTEVLFEQLGDLAMVAEEISFAGGEPLIMEEHYRILDMLIAKGLTNVRLRYNTNLSMLNFRGASVLDYWKQFPNVWVAASLDGSGLQGEYQRKEQNWEQTISNMIAIKKECPEVYLVIAPTISVFNVFQIAGLHRQLVEKNLIDVKDFFINMLEQPEYYSIQMLPCNLKEKVGVLIKEHIEWISNQPSRSNNTPKTEGKKIETLVSFVNIKSTIQNFETLISFMNAKNTSQLIPQFRDITVKLDALRQENFSETFPELKSLMEDCPLTM
jgi:organic radical activating enzyme